MDSTVTLVPPASVSDVDRAVVDQRSHFPPLDGLRGLAILLVVFHHAFDPEKTRWAVVELIHMMNRSGWIGVNLFFVLSGFLIGGILIDSRGNSGYYQTFYARRSLRIFPLYYLFLVAFFFVIPWVLKSIGYAVSESNHKLIYFLYIANFSELFGIESKAPSLDSLWSLSVEEQVYLVWPAVIAMCPSRFLVRLMAAIMVASFLWRLGVLISHRSILMAFAWTPACLDAFAAGTIAAVAVRNLRGRSATKSSARVWLIGSGLFVLGLSLGQDHFSFWLMPKKILTIGLTGLSIAFASAIAYLVSDKPDSLPNRVLSVGWLRRVGQYSYAIYLFHMPIAVLVEHFCNRLFGSHVYKSLQVQILAACSTLLLSYVLAWASWHLVEKHFLKLKRAFPSRGRGVPAVAAVSA